jgi:hypothetical protein
MTSCDRCVSFTVTVVNGATDHVNDLIAQKPRRRLRLLGASDQEPASRLEAASAK